MANGPDGVIGKFDIDRVTDLIEKAMPIYTAQDSPPKEGLTAEDIVTNQFIDDIDLPVAVTQLHSTKSVGFGRRLYPASAQSSDGLRQQHLQQTRWRRR